MNNSDNIELSEFAGQCGIETSYIDVEGEQQHASPQTLRAVLQTLGRLEENESIPNARSRYETRKDQQWIQPVILWKPDLPHFSFLLNLKTFQGQILNIQLTAEGQAPLSFCLTLTKNHEKTYRHTLPISLPVGYHQLAIQYGQKEAKALIVCPPPQTFPFPEHSWGMFAPLYGLRENKGAPFSSFSELTRLAQFAGQPSKGLVATLPLLASYLRAPIETSPYSPISRRYWNEIYLDITQIERFQECEQARNLWNSKNYQKTSLDLGQSSIVDYQNIYAHRRSCLEALSQEDLATPSRRADLERFVASHPEMMQYAQFRANEETLGRDWTSWSRSDYQQQPAHLDYHLYTQWQTQLQLERCSQEADKAGSGLYLDLPIGTHARGFDTWVSPHLFAQDMSVGAPPDPLALQGQNWCLPPEIPEQARITGYDNFRKSLSAHMKFAKVLRIDHVMGLQRLYWIPQGMPGSQGVYVQNQTAEMFAIVCLESYRNQCAVVGEDLGTVSPSVRQEMETRGMARMYVDQLSSPEDSVIAGSMASLGTHDTQTFASSLSEQGIPEDSFRKMLVERLSYLATSKASCIMVTLENLWLEMVAQNTPGEPLGNWQQPLRYTLDQIRTDSEINSLLTKIATLRTRQNLKHAPK